MSITLPSHYKLYVYDEISSTMDAARDHATTTTPGEVALIWAKKQTHGRGRHGRSWLSKEGNLYSSFVVYPKVPVKHAYEISFVGALAVGHALEKAGLDSFKYKWPNDIFINGAKVGGVLLELEAYTSDQYYVIVGVGINVNDAPKNMMYPTTCLAEHMDKNIEVSHILEHLAHAFEAEITLWQEGGFDAVRERWIEKALVQPGAPIVVKAMGTSYEGVFLDLDASGALLMQTLEGEAKKISAGDVYF